MSCKVSRPWMCLSIGSESRIPQYYRDRCWCRRAAQSPDIEREKRRGAEHHGWYGEVPGITEWDGTGQSGTEQRWASRSGTDQDGTGQVAWSSIRYDWSTGIKERDESWNRENRSHRPGWGGVR